MASSTKEALGNALKKMLNIKPIDKITVKDLVEECGVNRQTFYYHFDSIPDLVEDIVSDITKEIIENNASVRSLEECIEIGAKVAIENKKVLMNIYNSANRNVYEIYLMKACQSVVEQYIETVFGEDDVNSFDRGILVRFYKCECFGQIIDWMNNSMSYDLSKELCRLCHLREGFAEEVARRCRKN